jgi:PKD repeat protein
MKKIFTLAILFCAMATFGQKAVEFNGTDGRVVVDSSQFSMASLSGLTFATWVNADLLQNNRYIFDFSDSAGHAAGTDGMRFMMLNTYNNFQRRSNMVFYFYFNQTNPPTVTGVVTGMSSQWVHVAAVITHTSTTGNDAMYDVILYVNGAEAARGVRTISHANAAMRALHLAPNSNLRLGTRFDNRANGHLPGSLDDFIIYNRALTPSELHEIACNGALPASGRILYYAFEEGRNSIAIDSTQTGAHGILSSGASWGTGIAGGLGSSAPVSDFTFATNSPSLVVTFTNASTGGSERMWYFGDGDSSLLNNPVHTYANPGKYNVCLKITNSCGVSNTKCEEVNVVCPPAVASFIKTSTDKKVTFEADTNGVSNFTWDFGDGSPLLQGSDKGTVTKIFPEYKDYTVCLYVESPCGNDTLCEKVNIAIVGLQERNTSATRIFPNPANDYITVQTELSGVFSARVLDINGREVMQPRSVKDGSQLTLDGLVGGTYILEMQWPDRTERLTFSVK